MSFASYQLNAGTIRLYLQDQDTSFQVMQFSLFHKLLQQLDPIRVPLLQDNFAY